MSNFSVSHLLRPTWRHAVLPVVALVAVSSLVANLLTSEDSLAQAPQSVSDSGAATSFADVVENVSPAVVNITVTTVGRAAPTMGLPERLPRGNGSSLDEFFNRFFDMPNVPRMPQSQRRSQGVGTGFLIDRDGYVVTNYHVIEGAQEVVVTIADGDPVDASIIGHDPKTDLALLKVDSDDALPFVEFGDSDRARVGDWVLAIGNPFGLGGTVTAGIISARGRDIQSGPYDDYLQIDAPINRGNSGGPIFNAAGEVIGINTAIFSPTGGSIGIGFAIPANQAAVIIAQLKDSGRVTRGWLGVQIQDLDEDLAESLDLASDEGALVAEVLASGPAENAGVMPGDVITDFDGHDIDSAKTLSRVVGLTAPGKRVIVNILRQGETRELRVSLGDATQFERVAQH